MPFMVVSIVVYSILIEMFSRNSGERLLLACDSQHFAGVVNLIFYRTVKYALCESGFCERN